MQSEVLDAPRPTSKAQAQGKRGEKLDAERLHRTVQHLLHGFHAGLLDTSFMTDSDGVLDMTMSG